MEHSRVVGGTRALFNTLLFSGSMALPDQAQRSSQAPPRTEHYASVAYRFVFFTSETSEKLFVNQGKTKKDKEKQKRHKTITTYLTRIVLRISVLLSYSPLLSPGGDS